MKWGRFISVETVPKVAAKTANLSETPSGRFSFQLIWGYRTRVEIALLLSGLGSRG
jgi:hypothetical protein